ncbi:uncharacterized protein [Venturia canescens]|uniref:uncharacterized protein n=1 Tax=Venturia canescens TaxID=32260 RepID=UPI001C9D4D8B|nr:uncharacterized protein LOC122411170 [Venturia canescens]
MSRCILVVCALVLMVAASSYCANIGESLLPGPVSPMQQCRDREPGNYVGVCEPESPADMCSDLKCAPNRGDIPFGVGTGPALDGTWCGPKKMCSMGSCVDDPEERRNPFDAEKARYCQQ